MLADLAAVRAAVVIFLEEGIYTRPAAGNKYWMFYEPAMDALRAALSARDLSKPLLDELAAARALVEAVADFGIKTRVCPACLMTVRGFGQSWPHKPGCAFVAHYELTKR